MIELGRQNSGEECVEACWMRKFVDPSVTGVTIRVDRRNNQCWCATKNINKKNTNHFNHMKTCFFKYQGAPPPALPPLGEFLPC